ncbi:MAG: hypothetical protein U5L45_13855 [Saprospiraceae bacterium]|nr:hypothetical protein [Saprospiraceae bacterium]
MVHFSGFARKMNHSLPFARAKRAQKCLLMRILNLCMVSKPIILIHKAEVHSYFFLCGKIVITMLVIFKSEKYKIFSAPYFYPTFVPDNES